MSHRIGKLTRKAATQMGHPSPKHVRRVLKGLPHGERARKVAELRRIVGGTYKAP